MPVTARGGGNDENNNEALASRVRALLDEGQAVLESLWEIVPPAKAIEQANRALEIFKKAREGVTELSETYSELKVAVKLGIAETYSQRGHQYRYLHNHAEALADLSQALKMNQTKAEDYYYRALSYLAKGDLRQAKTDLTDYLKRGDNDFLRRQAKEQQAKLVPGQEDDQKDKILHWRNEGYRFNSEASSASQPRGDDAKPDWHKAIRLYNQAIDSFNRALEVNSADAMTKLGMIVALKEQAYAYRQVDETDLALDNYARANQLRADSEYAFLRGETLLEAGYLPEAKQALQQYLAQGGTLSNKMLAEKYLQAKDNKKAGQA